MAAKKLPEPGSTSTPEYASDWFRQFLKHLELEIADGGRELQAGSDVLDCVLIAIQALHRTLLDSGLDEQQIAAIFGRVVSKKPGGHGGVQWTAELNQRRFVSSAVQMKFCRATFPYKVLAAAPSRQRQRIFTEWPFSRLESRRSRLRRLRHQIDDRLSAIRAPHREA